MLRQLNEYWDLSQEKQNTQFSLPLQNDEIWAEPIQVLAEKQETTNQKWNSQINAVIKTSRENRQTSQFKEIRCFELYLSSAEQTTEKYYIVMFKKNISIRFWFYKDKA